MADANTPELINNDMVTSDIEPKNSIVDIAAIIAPYQLKCKLSDSSLSSGSSSSSSSSSAWSVVSMEQAEILETSPEPESDSKSDSESGSESIEVIDNASDKNGPPYGGAALVCTYNFDGDYSTANDLDKEESDSGDDSNESDDDEESDDDSGADSA
jgi:hypothetical protein